MGVMPCYACDGDHALIGETAMCFLYHVESCNHAEVLYGCRHPSLLLEAYGMWICRYSGRSTGSLQVQSVSECGSLEILRDQYDINKHNQESFEVDRESGMCMYGIVEIGGPLSLWCSSPKAQSEYLSYRLTLSCVDLKGGDLLC